MSDYNQSQEILDIAEKLIDKHHPDLVDANIAYMVKEGQVGRKITKKSKGKATKIVKASKLADLMSSICKYHFVIEVDGNLWGFLNDEQKKALLDEALCHFGWDDGPYTKDPITIFPENVKRYGWFTKELQNLAKEFQQMDFTFEKLPDPQEEPVEKETPAESPQEPVVA